MTKVIDKRTGEEFEGNPKFYQFYKHNFRTIRKLMNESTLATKLFFLLVELMDDKNAVVVSQNCLEEALGVSKMSVYTATKILKEHKYITTLKSGTSLIYCINADIVWTQRADKKVFAKFEAAVYLSGNEQEEIPTVTKVQYQKRVEIEKKKDIKQSKAKLKQQGWLSGLEL